jgi:4a-hydroxytetrahydrobiopterin dehydratase
MKYTRVPADEIAALDALDDWRVVLGSIHATFRAGSFVAAADLAATIAAVADDLDHHPDLDLRYPDVVHVSVTTHAAGGLTTLDVDLARRISAAAAAAAATAEPTAAQSLEIAIDTMDADRIRPFWAAVLGYVEDARGGGLHDPRRIGPPLWFQQMDEPRTDRDRFHLDVSVPHDAAAARIEAALAAGGTLVTDAFARAWWVLADADGNEACICTWQDRTTRPGPG